MKKYTLVKDDSMYLDQDGVSWDSVADWLWIGILGGCGCGSGELPDMAVEVLLNFGTDFEDRKLDVYSNLGYEVIAHWMDDKELTEHGTSISGCWLTDKGKEIYDTIIVLK